MFREFPPVHHTVDCLKPEKLIDRCYIIISLLGIMTFSQLTALVYRQDIIYTMRLWIHCYLFNVLLYFDVHQYNIITLKMFLLLLNPVNSVVTKKVKWLYCIMVKITWIGAVSFCLFIFILIYTLPARTSLIYEASSVLFQLKNPPFDHYFEVLEGGVFDQGGGL